jgi:hypothetical protein
MSNLLWKSLLVSPAVLGATLVVSTSAFAATSATKPATKAEVTQTEVAQTATNEEKPEAFATNSALQLAANPDATQNEVLTTVADLAEPEVTQKAAALKATPETLAATNSALQLAATPITTQQPVLTTVAEIIQPEVATDVAAAQEQATENPEAVATNNSASELAAIPATTQPEVAPEAAATPEKPEAVANNNSVTNSALQLAATPVVTPVPEFTAVKELEQQKSSDKTKAQPVVVQPQTVAQINTPVAQTPSANTNVLNEVKQYSNEGRTSTSDSLSQVTSVSQFSDVQPTDWAFQALQSLVERYGCIAGYPDGTFRGNRAMTRYEFAAGLNACLDRVNELIATATANLVKKEDLATLQRLQEEFAAELATLRGRVDALEARTAELEANQFSTTTKLVGEVIAPVTDVLGGDYDANIVAGGRARLDFQTSFTGKDILHTRIAAGNLGAFDVGGGNAVVNNVPVTFGSTSETFQTFNLSPGGNNDAFIDWLAYEFKLGPSQVYLAAAGGLFADFAPVNNPYFYDGDGGNGSLSVFAQESPIYRIGGGAGAGIRLGVGKAPILGPTSLTLGYLADNGNNPNQDFGLFNGDYAALAQLNFNIGDRIGIGATYVHGYHNRGNAIFDAGGPGRDSTGVTGTFFANRPGAIATAVGLPETPAVTNSYGLQAAFRLSNQISISGFLSYTDVELTGPGNGEVWSYGLGVAFPDLGKKGNILGIFAGAQPYLGKIDFGTGVGAGVSTSDRPYHIEAFYKYQLTNNISVTPGIVWLTAPNQNGDNDDAVIGTVRTTFNF